jgi:hypothetical protein
MCLTGVIQLCISCLYLPSFSRQKYVEMHAFLSGPVHLGKIRLRCGSASVSQLWVLLEVYNKGKNIKPN